jgi:hypothetical protein
MTVPYIDKTDGSISPQAMFVEVPTCLEPWLAATAWVLWRWKWNGKRHTKPPFQIDGRSLASNTDPKTWAKGDEAVQAANAKGYGVGLVLTGIPDLVALDLDGAISSEDGVATWALELIARARSYTEVSPSGTGFRIFGRSTRTEPIGTTVQYEGGHVEVYRHTRRYVTVTGEQWGQNTDLSDLDNLLGELVPNGALKATAGPEEGRPSDEAGYRVLVSGLKPDFEERACRPCGPSDDRSAAFKSMVNVLKLKGFGMPDALRYVAERPQGPASKYIEGGRLEQELARSWAKAREPDEGSGAALPQATGERPKLLLEPWEAIDFDLNADEFLVEGILPSQGLATLYGPPKSYKSFVGVDMALAVAQGVPWGAREVKQGPVVYVAGEGVAGLRKRVKGFRMHHGIEGQEVPFFLVSARLNLGAAAGDTADLVTAVRGVHGAQRPALIVIDTLSRMLAGQSENAEGMFNFVNNAEALSDELGCAVLAVHHEGKNSEAGMRGSSNLLGAVVAAIRVRRTADRQAVLTVEAAKDGDDDVEVNVTLEKFELGHNKRGKAVTTLLVKSVRVGTKRPAEKSSTAAARPPATRRAFMQAFEELLFEDAVRAEVVAGAAQVECVPVEAVRQRYLEKCDDGAAPDSRRRAFDRHMRAALDSDLLRVANVAGGRVVWKP